VTQEKRETIDDETDSHKTKRRADPGHQRSFGCEINQLAAWSFLGRSALHVHSPTLRHNMAILSMALQALYQAVDR
jgi:hypothetical protein